MKGKNPASEKRNKKFLKYAGKQRELHGQLKEHGGDILNSDNFRGTKDFLQHGTMTVKNHSIDVAKYSLALNKKLGLNCNKRDLVRGALLHDYFLYDWHDKKTGHRLKLHGFYHPGIALENAAKEYELTNREKDIIKKHMWPLTVVPPLCREAWIVTTADKYCSLLETIRLHKGRGKQTVRKNGKKIKQKKKVKC